MPKAIILTPYLQKSKAEYNLLKRKEEKKTTTTSHNYNYVLKSKKSGSWINYILYVY